MVGQKAVLALAALLPFAFGQISDDFESGWDKTKWPIYAPDCNQGGSVVLDSTVAHSGSNSLKVTGGSNGYCGHIFFGTDQVPDGNVFVRTWMRHSTALGDNHVTFLTMPDSGLGAGKHLRLSGQMEIFEYNRESDDATLPGLSPDGIASSTGFPINTWLCLEYHLKNDGTIETWVNGNAIAGLTTSNWSGYKPDIQGAYFGWESYAGSVDTVWYDDVAIGSSRIGCSAAGATGGAPTSAAPTKASSTSMASSTSKTSSATITPSTTAPSSPTSTSVALPTTTSVGGQQCQIVYVDA